MDSLLGNSFRERSSLQLDVVVRIFNLSTQEADADGSLGVGGQSSVWSTL